jgi:integrase
MVQSVHVTLHKALKQAVMDGVIPRNVTEAVKAPQPEKKEIRPLSLKQARALLRAANEEGLEALYVLAITTGMRQGELLALKCGAPKTAKSRRSIKLPNTALSSLKKHRKAQLEERMRLGELFVDQGLVFTSRVGTPISRQDLITRSFKPLLKRAGLPNIRFHDLRHTCATLLLSKSVHAKFVQELLGHATISNTLDTYSHVLPGMGDAAAGRWMRP